MFEQSHEVQEAYRALKIAIEQEQAAMMLVKTCESRVRTAHAVLATAITKNVPDDELGGGRFVAVIHDLEAKSDG